MNSIRNLHKHELAADPPIVPIPSTCSATSEPRQEGPFVGVPAGILLFVLFFATAEAGAQSRDTFGGGGLAQSQVHERGHHRLISGGGGGSDGPSIGPFANPALYEYSKALAERHPEYDFDPSSGLLFFSRRYFTWLGKIREGDPDYLWPPTGPTAGEILLNLMIDGFTFSEHYPETWSAEQKGYLEPLCVSDTGKRFLAWIWSNYHTHFGAAWRYYRNKCQQEENRGE